MKLFLLIFEKGKKCGDIEIRLCSAESREEAIKIALFHRNEYYPKWSFTVRDIEWDGDNTAYVYGFFE